MARAYWFALARSAPDVFGGWNSVFRRFSRWSRKGVRWRIFAATSGGLEFKYLIIDSIIIRVHQHASGPKKGPEDRAIGISRSDLSTKMCMAVRGPGCPVCFVVTAGQRTIARKPML